MTIRIHRGDDYNAIVELPPGITHADYLNVFALLFASGKTPVAKLSKIASDGYQAAIKEADSTHLSVPIGEDVTELLNDGAYYLLIRYSFADGAFADNDRKESNSNYLFTVVGESTPTNIESAPQFLYGIASPSNPTNPTTPDSNAESVWIDTVVASWLAYNSHCTYSAAVIAEVRARLSSSYIMSDGSANYYTIYGSSGLNRTDGLWFVVLEFAGTFSHDALMTKSGAVLKWDIERVIYNTVASLTGITSTGNGVIMVTSSDGFSGISLFGLEGVGYTYMPFKGNFPRINIPAMTALHGGHTDIACDFPLIIASDMDHICLTGTKYTGIIPQFDFPVCRDFFLSETNFNALPANPIYLPNCRYLRFDYMPNMSGTVPNFGISRVGGLIHARFNDTPWTDYTSQTGIFGSETVEVLFQNCALTQEAIDAILADLDRDDVVNLVRIRFQGANNSYPSTAGLAHIAAIQSRNPNLAYCTYNATPTPANTFTVALTGATMDIRLGAMTSGVTVSINWGDGTIQPITLTQQATYSGYQTVSHTYADSLAHTATVTLTNGVTYIGVPGSATYKCNITNISDITSLQMLYFVYSLVTGQDLTSLSKLVNIRELHLGRQSSGTLSVIPNIHANMVNLVQAYYINSSLVNIGAVNFPARAFTITATGNSFTASTLSTWLVSLNATGLSNGTFAMSSGLEATLTPEGVSALAALRGRGVTITV